MRKKTNAQIKRMFGLGRPLGCGKEELEELACDVTNGRTERLSKLTFDEANAMIERLGGDAFPVSRSLRTVQYHRQKAGVTQIVTPRQMKYLEDLAAKRNITDEGLERLCRKILGRGLPRTTKDANKVIEALKSMIARDAKPAAAGSGGRNKEAA
ncbi:MAG TPA: hypothetical protein VMM38_01465 [Aridibacter sp.]|nr:hypothetical protein [Aridibacter sp.]